MELILLFKVLIQVKFYQLLPFIFGSNQKEMWIQPIILALDFRFQIQIRKQGNKEIRKQGKESFIQLRNHNFTFCNNEILQNIKFYSNKKQFSLQHQMLRNQQQQLTQNKSYGKIYPIKWGFYTNPQMPMFIFTLLLTLTFSIVMIYFVFIGVYHKSIGTLLCIYVTYRFISLGLSNPGLAIQSYDQYFQKEIQINNQIGIYDGQSHQSDLNASDQQSYRHFANNGGEMENKLSQQQNNKLKNAGFYTFCQDCKIPIKKSAKHCKICKTCIDGFDHHCIWIGKCIGKKNMWQFKEFLCFVFVTLIYALILSIQMSKVQRIT